ncbi:hypothetical protein IJ098_01350 [Candidatus Saccharibacteria bacterium]|nr:hypothetical protein [Candidatus Saccharibacteria bacterium]
MTLSNNSFGTREVTANNATVKLAVNEPYQIFVDFGAEYDFVEWSTTASGVLGDTSANPTTYTVSSTATLTVEVEERTGAFYLQDVTTSSCSTTPKIALDVRDNQQYKIQKLADGRCWMLDSLRLGAVDLVEQLTVGNTNMDTNTAFALPASGLVDDYDNPRLDSSESNSTTSGAGGIGANTIGVRYNYCAASAGTACTRSSKVNTSYDICPAGWSLPNGDPNTGDLAVLKAAYNNNWTSVNTALSFIYTGYWNANGTGVNDLGSVGYYWTSTGYNNNKSYAIEPSRGNNKANGAVRNNGIPIRCVLK